MLEEYSLLETTRVSIGGSWIVDKFEIGVAIVGRIIVYIFKTGVAIGERMFADKF